MTSSSSQVDWFSSPSSNMEVQESSLPAQATDWENPGSDTKNDWGSSQDTGNTLGNPSADTGNPSDSGLDTEKDRQDPRSTTGNSFGPGQENDRSNTRGSFGRGFNDRGSRGRGYSDRGYNNRGSSDRGYSDRGSFNRGSSGRGYSDRGSFNRGYNNRDSYDRGSSGRGYSDRGSSGRGYSDRGFSDRGSSGRGYNNRGSYDGDSYGRGSYVSNQRRGGYNQGSWGSQEEKMDDISISKSLSNILRHTAEKMNLQMDANGFIYVDDLLKLRRFFGVKFSDIERVVQNNDKQRFSLTKEESSEKFKIRANQGHSVKFENLDLDLTPIDDAEKFPHVLHGTYYNCWPAIQREGLKKMKRVHIHFAPGIPGDDGVISGMRSSCEILVFVNLKKAIEDGLKFFVSANNVILSSGDKDGIIGPQYFSKVVDRKLGNLLNVESCSPIKKKILPVGMVEEDLDKYQAAKKTPKKAKKDMESTKPLPVGMSQEDLSSKKQDSKKKSKKAKKESDAEKYSSPDEALKTLETEVSASEIPKEDEGSNELAEKPEDKPSKNKMEKTRSLVKKDETPDVVEKEVPSSKEDAKDSESNKTSKKSKKSDPEENVNLEDNPKAKETKPAPKVFIIDNAEDEELNQLKEHKVLGVHALKQALDIVYILISIPDTVFVFDLVGTKEYLKTLLENKECQKVMFDYRLMYEMRDQLEITLYEKPVADIQVLFSLSEKRSLAKLPEIVGEVCGKRASPQTNLDKITETLGEKTKNLRKTLVHVSELLPLYEKYKSSLDCEEDIINKHKFDESTKTKINELLGENKAVDGGAMEEEDSQPSSTDV